MTNPVVWQFAFIAAVFILSGWHTAATAPTIADRNLKSGDKGPSGSATVAAFLMALIGLASVAASVFWLVQQDWARGLGVAAGAIALSYLSYSVFAQPVPGSAMWSDPEFRTAIVKTAGRASMVFGAIVAILGAIYSILSGDGPVLGL